MLTALGVSKLIWLLFTESTLNSFLLGFFNPNDRRGLFAFDGMTFNEFRQAVPDIFALSLKLPRCHTGQKWWNVANLSLCTSFLWTEILNYSRTSGKISLPPNYYQAHKSQYNYKYRCPLPRIPPIGRNLHRHSCHRLFRDIIRYKSFKLEIVALVALMTYSLVFIFDEASHEIMPFLDQSMLSFMTCVVEVSLVVILWADECWLVVFSKIIALHLSRIPKFPKTLINFRF